jgi:hypothetical protein
VLATFRHGLGNRRELAISILRFGPPFSRPIRVEIIVVQHPLLYE